MHTLPSPRTHARRRIISPWAALTLCIAAPFGIATAYAQTTAQPYNSATPSFVDLSIGSSDFSKPSNGFGVYSSDQRATAYSLSVGSYVFSPNWGLAAGYTDFGSVNRAGGTTTANGFNLDLIGRLPLSTSWSLVGKVGTLYGHTNVTSAPASRVSAGSESDYGWNYGLGVELQLAPQWSTVLQYEESNFKFPGGNVDQISATKLSVRYHY